MPEADDGWPEGTPKALIKALEENPQEVVEFLASRGTSLDSCLAMSVLEKEELANALVVRFADAIPLATSDVGRRFKTRGGWEVVVDGTLPGEKYAATHFTALMPIRGETRWHKSDGTAPGTMLYDIVLRADDEPPEVPETTRWEEII